MKYALTGLIAVFAVQRLAWPEAGACTNAPLELSPRPLAMTVGNLQNNNKRCVWVRASLSGCMGMYTDGREENDPRRSAEY